LGRGDVDRKGRKELKWKWPCPLDFWDKSFSREPDNDS